MSLSLFYEDDNITIKKFIFKYLLPIDILNSDKIREIMENNKLKIYENIYNNDRFFNKLKVKKNKINIINTFINIIDKEKLNYEIIKDIRRNFTHIYINNKILFDKTPYELAVMNENYVIDTLNEKLKEEITKDEKIIILIKNTLFQVMPAIYWPFITKFTLFIEYPFLDNKQYKYIKTYFGDNEITFKTYNNLCNINISSLNNKITQHIDYTNDLGILYNPNYSDQPPLYFGKSITELLIDYTNDSVNIQSKTIIYEEYKIIFDFIKKNPNLSKNTLDILFNEKFIKTEKFIETIKDLYTKNYIFNNSKLFNKQKEKKYNDIINDLIKLIIINENYVNLLYFFNEIRNIFIEKNIEGIFLKFLFNRYEQLNNIINYEDDYSNYYYKIILFYRNLYIFFDEYSEKESDYDQYFNNKEYLNKSLKELLYNFSLKPITKKNISYKSDFLIISYNEDDQIFNINDCISMLYKITIEEPAIIILCTQHSKVKDSFQDFLNNELTDETISKTNFGYKKILQINPSKLFKNSKTTLYIKNNSFLFFEKFLKKDKKQLSLERTTLTYDIEKHNIEKKNITSVDNIRNNFFIKKISYGVNNKSIVRKVFELSLFKTNIFLELIIEKNSKEYKFIIINTHLYFSKNNSDTGLTQRTKEFFDLIDDLKLDNYYKEGYNIFFCGDLNFRLYSIDKKNKNINYKEISNSIISNYLKDNKEVFKEKYETTNELTKIIKERLQSTSKNEQILSRFNKSIMLTGYDLTCKYIKNDTNYKSKINNEIKKENFKLRGNKLKTYPIIPSMCDRILYATNDLNIKSNNFKVYSIPKKSDHKIITLSFELESKKNNQIQEIPINRLPQEIARINNSNSNSNSSNNNIY